MCNGLQVMTKLGLLPGPVHEDDPVDRLCVQRVSVVGNERLGYRDGWVRMRCDPESPCVWTRGIDVLESPARHGEGKLVFGEGVPVNSTKGMTGHTLGAAGAVEAVLSVLGIEEGRIPASPGTREVDPALRAHYEKTARAAPLARVLSNSFGFGGSNCSLVLGRAAA
jgi:hypothetical protein